MSYLWQRHVEEYHLPSTPLDNIRVMVIVWRLRGNIIRTALCWIVWHNVHSQQHTYVSSSYRSNRLALSHWDHYAVRRGSCLELYYCNMVEWFWCDSSLISTTNWFPSVLWHCWFGHLACKNRPRNNLLCVEWDVKPYTLTHVEEYEVKPHFRRHVIHIQ